MNNHQSCDLVVLVEDTLTEQFVRRVLRNLNFQRFRILSAPASRGSAEQWVRDAYVSEVLAYRRRRAKTRPNNGLLVVVDADLHTVEERKRQLESGVSEARSEDDRIAIWVPRRHMETWLAWFSSVRVTEEDDVKWHKPTVNVDRAAKVFAALFYEQMQPSPHLLPSIVAALEETRRIRA